MKPLYEYTDSQLEKLIETADKRFFETVNMFVEVGRGNERPSDICKLDDPLSLEWMERRNKWRTLVNEKESREYHGSKVWRTRQREETSEVIVNSPV